VKKPAIVSRYLFLEMIPPFGVTLVFFTFIFLMSSLLELTNLIINYRIGLGTVLRMLFYSVPFFLEFVIPMAVMLAVLLAFLRMSSDNEIVALKAGGVSIYRLLPPALLFCLAGFVATGVVSTLALPWGKTAFKKSLVEVATRHFDIALKERTFNESVPGMMLYINRVDLKSRNLVDVFIEDRRTKGLVSTIVAPEGRVFRSAEGTSGRLRLFDGTIHHVDLAGNTVHFLRFDTYDFTLDLKPAGRRGAGSRPDEEEMSVGELMRFVQQSQEKNERYYKALIELHERFSIPFACFALGLLAVPLGLQPMEGRRAVGMLLGLMFFTLYYIMLIMGWAFAESGVYPPALAMWVPNLVMGAIGVFLLIRTAKERPIRIDSLAMAVMHLASRRRRRSRRRILRGPQ
jgi:lipopolysaccharide export system permease protein